MTTLSKAGFARVSQISECDQDVEISLAAIALRRLGSSSSFTLPISAYGIQGRFIAQSDLQLVRYISSHNVLGIRWLSDQVLAAYVV